MRLVGLSKTSFVGMIFTQSYVFVLPAVAMGFACYYPVMMIVYGILFTEELGFEPDYSPSRGAALQALFLGLLIPALSAIIPIRLALAKSLPESLSKGRDKLSGVVVTLTDNRNYSMAPYLLFGLLALVYGTMIYYMLPKAMFEMNFNLILKIFFFILLGMLFGLTVLAANLQGVIGSILTQLFLFWESSSTRNILAKNIITHRQRNQLTSNIYALTLGCIIFLIVSAQYQVETISYLSSNSGADIIVQTGEDGILSAELIDPLLQSYASDVKDFVYMTEDL